MKYKVTVFLMILAIGMVSCGDDDVPPVVNPEEEITKVILTFTNTLDPSEQVSAEWFDEDGDGGLDPTIEPIVLAASTAYNLDIEFINTFTTPPSDVSEEVLEEADEHMIFFAFLEDAFTSPAGSGNIPDRNEAINYQDQDVNGFPLGLSSGWTTGLPAQGSFRAVLKHQPDIKSATTTVQDGETDVDVTFQLIIQ